MMECILGDGGGTCGWRPLLSRFFSVSLYPARDCSHKTKTKKNNNNMGDTKIKQNSKCIPRYRLNRTVGVCPGSLIALTHFDDHNVVFFISSYVNIWMFSRCFGFFDGNRPTCFFGFITVTRFFSLYFDRLIIAQSRWRGRFHPSR
jgi:hypothetical protein